MHLPVFLRFNELLLRWTSTETWVFQRRFNVSASVLSQDNVDLVLTGVDTVADIFIDDTLIRSVYNAHRSRFILVELCWTWRKAFLCMFIMCSLDTSHRARVSQPKDCERTNYCNSFVHHESCPDSLFKRAKSYRILTHHASTEPCDAFLYLACVSRQYRIPIKEALNGSGTHLLKLVIHPASIEANKRAAAYPYNVPGLTQPGGMSYYNFLRKPASDFGWDWGPAFTPAGLYGSVQIEAYSNAILTGVHFLSTCECQNVQCLLHSCLIQRLLSCPLKAWECGSAAAGARQEHLPNGTIILSFDAYLDAPHAGESGTLQASVTDGSAQWSASENITFSQAGESNFTVQVHS
jgi:hypothetical protein